MKEFINAAILFYTLPTENAPTIMEHINAFKKYSKHSIYLWNTCWGKPSFLTQYKFDFIILHYSIFDPMLYNKKYWLYESLKYEITADVYKIAFFQDEYHYCQYRFNLINSLNIHAIYTLIDPQYFNETYQKYTNVTQIFHTLTGYVDESLVEKSKRLTKPWSERTIDVGYRARPLPFYMGKGAQEKTEIADKFLSHTKGINLVLDIKTAEADRIYGETWHEYLANCKAVLGVEAGVSVFDIEDKVRPAVEILLAKNPQISFEEVYNRVLVEWEDRIYYRTISPRIFEAAAFKVLQILYEGQYQGILQPNVHYIPLKKDFSNIDEVLEKLNDENLVNQITQQAYQDLIESGKFSYEGFIHQFDRHLLSSLGCDRFSSKLDSKTLEKISQQIQREQTIGKLWLRFKQPLYKKWPGKKLLKSILIKLHILKY